MNGNVYGAGFSASLPTVEVDSVGFRVEPYYYTELGTYRTGVKGQTTTYTWAERNSIGVDNPNHILYTNEDLDALGTVQGKVTLTVTGDSRIGTAPGDPNSGNVFGGGESSKVANSTDVTLGGNTHVYGSVYGGGSLGEVTGDTKVTITN